MTFDYYCSHKSILCDINTTQHDITFANSPIKSPHEFFANYYRDINTRLIDPIYKINWLSKRYKMTFHSRGPSAEPKKILVKLILFSIFSELCQHMCRISVLIALRGQLQTLFFFWQIDSEKCESSSFHNKTFHSSGKASINLTTFSISPPSPLFVFIIHSRVNCQGENLKSPSIKPARWENRKMRKVSRSFRLS